VHLNLNRKPLALVLYLYIIYNNKYNTRIHLYEYKWNEIAWHVHCSVSTTWDQKKTPTVRFINMQNSERAWPVLSDKKIQPIWFNSDGDPYRPNNVTRFYLWKNHSNNINKILNYKIILTVLLKSIMTIIIDSNGADIFFILFLSNSFKRTLNTLIL